MSNGEEKLNEINEVDDDKIDDDKIDDILNNIDNESTKIHTNLNSELKIQIDEINIDVLS